MRNELSDTRWGRVFAAGLAPHILWNVLLAVLVVLETDGTVATWFPWVASGGLLDAFSIWGIPAVTIGATAIGAVIVCRTVPVASASVHGTLIGLVAASIALLFQPLSLTAFALFLITVAAGWIGGVVGR